MDFDNFNMIFKGLLNFGTVEIIRFRDVIKHSDFSLNQLNLIISCIHVIKDRLDILNDELYKKKEMVSNEETEIRKSKK